MPRRPPSLPAPVRGLVAALVAVLLAGCQSAHPGAESIEAEQPPVAEPWAWELPDCVGYRAADYRAPAQRQQVRVRSRSDRTEQVEIYQPGWGERAFAEIRRVLRECARYEAGGRDDPDAYRQQHLIIDTGFAGDESLLVKSIRLRPPEQHTAYAVVVRVADQITTIRTEELGPEELRALVR